jgi:hypothetical protein
MNYATTSHICGDRRKFVLYTGFTRNDKLKIRDIAGRVAGKAIGQGDVQLRIQLPGGRDGITEVVLRDVHHVEGAHNSRSQSRFLDRGLQIVPVNCFRMKLYDNAPTMGTGPGGQECLVAVAPQVGGLFRFVVHMKVRRTGHRWSDVSGDMLFTSLNAITIEHTYRDVT